MRDFFIRNKRFLRNHKRYFLILGIFLIGLLILGFFFFSSSEEVKALQKCGDGTFEGYCSLNKPYFCSGGILVENVSFCGCPSSSSFSEGKCILKDSFFQNKSILEKNFSKISKVLRYHFGNNRGKINFEFSPQILDYLLSLPRVKFYSKGERPRRDDFKLAKINEPIQKDYLMPLVVAIQNIAPNSTDLQALIAIHLVQNIKYNESEFVTVPGSNFRMRLSRYPYQVIGEGQGSCEGKSELLAFLLKEMGFGVSLFYYQAENHEALGIKCPFEESYNGTGYCFVETTMPSPVSYSEGKYLGISGVGKLESQPEIVIISKGFSLGEGLDEYRDAEDLKNLVDKIDKYRKLNFFDKRKMDSLREKYDLTY